MKFNYGDKKGKTAKRPLPSMLTNIKTNTCKTESFENRICARIDANMFFRKRDNVMSAICKLHYFWGFTQAELAEIFGVSFTNSSETEVASEDVQASNRLRSIGESASTPSKVDDIETRLKNAKSDDEITAIWEDSRKYFL
jgi:hypothetical protein